MIFLWLKRLRRRWTRQPPRSSIAFEMKVFSCAAQLDSSKISASRVKRVSSSALHEALIFSRPSATTTMSSCGSASESSVRCSSCSISFSFWR